MTREEAITIIKPLMLMMKNPQGEVISDAYYALEMAVQALLQEPSGDVISRQAAIKSIEERAKRIKNEDTLNGLAGAVGILFELPSVKPQPCEDAVSRQAVLDYIHRILNQGTGKKKSFEFIQKYVEKLPSVKPKDCDTCEVGNPCLYCKHDFDPQEISDRNLKMWHDVYEEEKRRTERSE